MRRENLIYLKWKVKHLVETWVYEHRDHVDRGFAFLLICFAGLYCTSVAKMFSYLQATS